MSFAIILMPGCFAIAQTPLLDQVELAERSLGRTYSGLYFTAADSGYVYTERAILRTADGGDTWQLLQTFAAEDRIGQIFFLDASTAWIYIDSNDVSRNTLWRTRDGFASLQQMGTQFQRHDKAVIGFIYNDVFFLDSEHGWGLGGPRHITVTTDAGLAWTGNLLPSALGRPTRVVMFPPTVASPPTRTGTTGPNEGIAETEEGMIRTTNGGATWQAIPDTPERLEELSCVGRSVCMALDVQNQVFASLDAGMTWSLQTLPLDKPTTSGGRDEVRNLQVASPTRAYIFGLDTHMPPPGQRIIVKPDGTRTTPRYPKTSFLLKYDGTTWTRENYDNILSLGTGQFVDDLHGWAVSSRNNIFRTIDGGQTWTTVQDYYRQQAALIPRPQF